MEYRRSSNGRSARTNGYYRKKNRRKSSDKASDGGLLAVIMPLAAFAAVLYLLLGTSFGDMLLSKAGEGKSIKGILPFSCTEEKSAQQTAPPTGANAEITAAPTADVTELPRPTLKVSLPRLNMYMLQMGVYSTESGAAEQALSLKQHGAAGYVYNDAGSYRVMLAAYGDEVAANGVRDRLTDEGYKCTVFSYTCSGAELLITAEQERLAAVGTAFNYAYELIDAIEQASVDFDAEQRSIEYGRTLLAEIAGNAVNAAAGIGSSAQTNDLLLYVYSYLNDIASVTDGVCTAAYTDRNEFASAVKLLRIKAGMRYASLLKQICD